jgi:HK97 family phage major capsid protein
MITDTINGPGFDPRLGYETRDGEEGGDENADQGLAEIRAAVQGLTGTVEQRLGALDTALGEIRGRVSAVEIVQRRPGAGGGNENQAPAVEQRAFTNFLRQGAERMPADEIRSLRVSDDTAGGYLAPDAFITDLQRNVVQFSPVRSVARVAPIGVGAALLPKRTGRMTAKWVGEVEDREETTITYGQNRYEVRELTAYVDVSNTLIEDSAFDIAAELAFDFAEEFGSKEASSFVNGIGSVDPVGFMNDSAIGYTASGDASKVTADGLIDLYHAIAPAYQANAVWMMNSATLGACRKLKDPSTGAYLLITAGIANAPQTTILGRPVVQAPDMPDIASNATPIVFGDFNQGYRIFDRVPISILRDPYSQATKGMTRFHGRRRVAGGTNKTEALRKLKIATS